MENRIHKIGSEIGGSPQRIRRLKNIKVCGKFHIISKLDRKYLRNETRQMEHGVANCNFSSARRLDLVNFGPQTAKKQDQSFNRPNALALHGSGFIVHMSLRFIRVELTTQILVIHELPVTQRNCNYYARLCQLSSFYY